MAPLRISIMSLLFVQSAAFSLHSSSMPSVVPVFPRASSLSARSDSLLTSSMPRFVTACDQASSLSARRDDNEDDDDDDYFGENDDYYEEPRRRRRSDYDNLGGSGRQEDGIGVPSPFGRRDGLRLPESVSKAVLAGIFVLGIGLGVTIDSQINTSPKDLASRDAVDQAAPNAQLCASYGASAMAFDQRVFVSFNPFNVYVAQADVKPACVLQQSNVVSVLRDRKLINDEEVRACKQNMNTWAFVGDLQNSPQLSCVYKSEDAQNEFLDDPKLGIGEDVYDDDRARAAQGKIVKGELTKGQKDAVRRQALNIPGFD